MRVVTFGEVMLRLAPVEFMRLRQVIPGCLESTFGGGELNVAVSIAFQGGESAYLTASPDNPITDCLVQEMTKLGVDGIVLSNHGGRPLDRGPVPLEILPEVVKAVGKKVDVFIDGSIMSGQDAYAAIALGAKAVLVGRAYLYGVMADGERGVEKVIEILRRDFVNTMALTGNRTLKEVRESGAVIRSMVEK